MKLETVQIFYVLLCVIVLIYTQFISKFIEKEYSNLEYKQKIVMFFAFSIIAPLLLFFDIMGDEK